LPGDKLCCVEFVGGTAAATVEFRSGKIGEIVVDTGCAKSGDSRSVRLSGNRNREQQEQRSPKELATKVTRRHLQISCP